MEIDSNYLLSNDSWSLENILDRLLSHAYEFGSENFVILWVWNL